MNNSGLLLCTAVSILLTSNIAKNTFAQEKRIPAKEIKIFQMYYHNEKAVKKNSGPVSEKKEKIKGGEKYDEPNMFAEFQREIRTRPGKSATDYPSNYLIEELSRSQARSRLFKPTVLNWVERGPGNVSGRTRGIIVDISVADNKTWFAGSVGGGIWKTTDAGATWVSKSDNMPNLATTALAQSRSNPDIIYCGTGEGFNNVDAVNGAGIFKSINHGESWVQLSSTAGPDFTNVNRIIVDPNNSDIVLACTNPGPNSTSNPGGVWRSTDGGLTWNRVLDKGSSRVQDLKADPANFSFQYCAVNYDGVYKSVNGGLSWIKTGDSLKTTGRIEIAVSGKNPNFIYASSQVSSGSGLYLSEDKGTTWRAVKSSDGKTQDWLGGQGWYDNTIAVDPNDENTVFFGGIDLWKAVIQNSGSSSTTRSATFSRVTDGYGASGKPYVHVDHHNIIPVPDPSSPGVFWIINGNDGGVSYSPDSGAHWYGNSVNNSLSNGGYNTTQFYGVDKKPGANEYIGGTQDNGTWISPSEASRNSLYAQVIGGDGFDAAWHYKDPNKIIGGSQYNFFRRTTDGGVTWNSATTGLEDVGSGKGVFISRIAKSNSDPDVIYTTGSQGVWRSEDFGASWSKSRITQSGGWSYSGTSTPVAVSIANPQVVWAGRRFSNSESRLFVSRDGGITFDSVYKPTGVIALGSISGINTHPTQMNSAFITYSFYGAPKILKTTDLGSTWRDISGFGNNSTSSSGFPNVATYCVLVMPRDTAVIWAGTEIGLFVSTDSGTSWRAADNGLPAVSIWDMKIVNDQVVVATHGRGIWSVSLPGLINYEPPAVTLSPIISALSQGVDRAINIVANLRSGYDSTLVFIDGIKKLKLPANAAGETSVKLIPATFGKITVQLIAYKSGTTYKSSLRTLDVYNLKPAQEVYTNYFDETADDFTGNGFTLKTDKGFSSPAAHSPHPYAEATDYFYNLLVPIKITSSAGMANIEYDDIALVEPGEPNSKFGDENFWDYVVVEGSRDGLTWIPFQDGYDCRYKTRWSETLFADPSTLSTTDTAHHKINMTNRFSAGDVVFVRFHLYSDEAVVGWGWAIDNLKIQNGVTDVGKEQSLPAEYSLSQNYPNPFNPETTIRFSVPQRSSVKLEIFDALGRIISTIVDSELDAGNYKYNWNGRSFASGIYFYRLTAGEFSNTKKLILMK